MIRLTAAAFQAIALLLLTQAALPPQDWPATTPTIFIPLLLVSIYVPVLVMLGVTQLRPRQLAIWAATATCALLALGYHEAGRGTFVPNVHTILNGNALFPRFSFWFPVTIALFIAHTLVVDSVNAWSITPDYRKHFDTAWKLGLQAALAAVFVGVFWAILGLGAGLFNLVNLHGFSRLIAHDWFYEPATTLALALSIQATDVQPALIRGTRSIVLALFSWLAPLLAAILAAFLLTLPFISLQPLFKTHFAASLLLTTALLLIFLINCCYQDGAEERAANTVKRIAASLGAVEILPCSILAITAITLRVHQHGWTVARIEAAMIAFVALCYGIGYLAAVIPGAAWLKRLERTNLITAYVMVALVLLINSTFADPARLMVASQLASLHSGEVPTDKFDFAALHIEGARWGHDALNDLAKREGPENQAIAKAALAALSSQAHTRYPSGIAGATPPPVTNEQLATNITVFPAGRKLPDRLNADIPSGVARALLNSCANQHCVAQYLTFVPHGREALLIIGPFSGSLLEQDATGKWSDTAQLNGNFFCSQTRDAVAAGQITMSEHPYPDILIGTERFTIQAPRGCK
jgi:hypothetical protein